MRRWLPESKALNFGLIAAFLAVISIDFLFAEIPELFSGGARGGSVIHALSLAYIASYIFYIIVVHRKQVHDKEHLDPYIVLKTRQIISGLREITLQMLFVAGEDSTIKYPSSSKFDEIAKKINPNDPPPGAYGAPVFGISSWWGFFRHWKNISETRSDDLLSNSQFLDTEHIRLLLIIRENNFLSILDLLPNTRNQDCSFLSKGLYELSEATKALENYCEGQFRDVARFPSPPSPSKSS